MNSSIQRYWIFGASKDSVKSSVAEGIAQASHGIASSLQLLRKGDFVIYYSGKQILGKPEICQEFTAIGKVKDNCMFHVQMSENFCPSRRNIEIFQSKDISILPLINDLNFIKVKKSWGYPFRFGFFEIYQYDFDLISALMHK